MPSHRPRGAQAFIPRIKELHFERPVRTILIADDEEPYRKDHQKAVALLGRPDIKTVVLRDGKEVFDYLKSHSGEIDLLLLDVRMPLLDTAFRAAEEAAAIALGVNILEAVKKREG